ncbi:MAG: signal recognition particle-docking protein FtsY [Ignavibacteriae bacterium]|nr:signal recognition particle-docking protein FtsY [Ignavibacteria bacterium]MBI3363342.1 signal recognition particle-docking protein FtsY [Ignavibacteriota bacterium]
MGFLDKFKFSRLKESLAKTRESLMGKVHRLLVGKTKIDDELLDNLEEILIMGDVGVATTTTIIDSIRNRVKNERCENPEELDRLLRDEIQKLLVNGSMTGDDPFVLSPEHTPHVVMIVGVNGVGKTTTIGKLAYNYRTAGKKVVIAAADTFRAAANEQLEIWAQRAQVEIIRQLHGADPAAVAYDALMSAMSSKADIMIIDTAGRLHTKVNLMEELKKIKRVLQKLDSDAPHELLLVLDASTGQNAIQQAKQFTAAVGITGLVLTKLDGTAKGGVVLAISNELNIPVKFIGVGEKIDDLQPFDRKAFVDALFEKA